MAQRADKYARNRKNRKLSPKEYSEGWKRAADKDVQRRRRSRQRS